MISPEVFTSFLAEFNRAVFPAHVVLYLLAIGAAAFIFVRPGKRADIIAKAVLGAFWAWLGVVYMVLFYTKINSAGYAWGALFLLQAVFFVVDIFWPKAEFKPYVHPKLGHVGAAIAGWALVGYPITALILKHGWPQLALFGCATPITIYTCGLLLFTFDRKPRWRFTFIPFLWSVVGGLGPAVQWRYYEDYTLFAAGVVMLGGWIWASYKYKKK